MRFEWDPSTAESSRARYGVSFEEAITIWDDPHGASVQDWAHSTPQDKRFLYLGTSDQGRVLTVACTMRGDVTRIIVARCASRQERRRYETAKRERRFW